MLLYVNFVNLFLILTIKCRGQNPDSGGSLIACMVSSDMPHPSGIADVEQCQNSRTSTAMGNYPNAFTTILHMQRNRNVSREILQSDKMFFSTCFPCLFKTRVVFLLSIIC